MKREDLFLGTLTSGGHLKTQSGGILLARITMQAAQSSDSAALEIDPQDLGKMALVRGDISGNVLYSAQIVEILSPVTGILFKSLLNKGIVSFEEFKNQLSEPGSREVNTREQKKLCALVLGHQKRSPGAINVNSNLTEFDFNDDLALRVEKKIQKAEVQRIYRRTYKELPDDINALAPDFVISLHRNAFKWKGFRH